MSSVITLRTFSADKLGEILRGSAKRAVVVNAVIVVTAEHQIAIGSVDGTHITFQYVVYCLTGKEVFETAAR
jgi:hypothetical protein